MGGVSAQGPRRSVVAAGACGLLLPSGGVGAASPPSLPPWALSQWTMIQKQEAVQENAPFPLEHPLLWGALQACRGLS